MNRFLKTYTTILLCCAAFQVSAQHTFNFQENRTLNTFQDSLIHISKRLLKADSSETKLLENANFVKTLVGALKTPHSFEFNFDSLKYVAIVKPSNNSFRIITWYVALNNGTYRFYGAIQMHTNDGALKLIPLSDNTQNFADTNEITTNQKWYGARYYEIIPVIMNGKQPFYVLLGWKGNNAKTTKKVIEILSFEKENPVFGKAVFEGDKTDKDKNRIIFEYNKLNSMTLTLEKSIGKIVFDHLAPYDPNMVGNFEFYGADLSFDAYKIWNGKLKLEQDVEVRNLPSANDQFYNDPKDKTVKPIKKL